MAKIYYNLIKVNQWSIDNVPVRWKSDVQALLDADIA
ncbi:CD1375 family protein [Pseudobacillus badius]|nr:CD1375 family protein [Bacillus badius]